MFKKHGKQQLVAIKMPVKLLTGLADVASLCRPNTVVLASQTIFANNYFKLKIFKSKPIWRQRKSKG
jgi:hypothetical protein